MPLSAWEDANDDVTKRRCSTMKCSCKLLALVMATMLVVGVTPSGQVKAQATPQDLAPAIQFCGQSSTLRSN